LGVEAYDGYKKGLRKRRGGVHNNASGGGEGGRGEAVAEKSNQKEGKEERGKKGVRKEGLSPERGEI